VTGALCEYVLGEYLAGEASNTDAVESIDVIWVPQKLGAPLISVDTIFPPILAVLEEQT
jgi:8-oxo-dGTP diphosphatase